MEYSKNFKTLLKHVKHLTKDQKERFSEILDRATPEQCLTATKIADYMRNLELRVTDQKSHKAETLKPIEGVGTAVTMGATKKVIETSTGRKEKFSLAVERDLEDGTLEITIPLDTPDWRRGEIESKKHNHERVTSVRARLQKKLRERGLEPNEFRAKL
jgi:hypothetical protein